MTNRLVHGLFLLLLGTFAFACTVEADPPPGAAGAPSAGSGPAAGGSASTAGTPGTGGSAPVAGVSAGGNPPITGGAGGALPVAGNGGQSVGGAGAAGAAGASGAGGGSAVPGGSLGCGKQPMEEPRKYLQHNLTVNVAAAYQPKYTNRKYYTYLPADYNPSKAYPLIFYGAGCGASGAENQPAMMSFNNQAILVFLLQVDGCFQAGSSGTADSPDIPYFDQALTEIENNYCIDKEKVFASGYSSGAWLSITLSCSHGDKLRGIAIAAGGQQPVLPPNCTGPVAALFFVSSGDGTNPIGGATGSGAARDRLLKTNGCSADTVAWDPRWPYCKKYTGCDANPVVWCDHGGGHSNGQPEKMASDGWWTFFTTLP